MVAATSINHSVNIHFCGGDVQEIAFFGPAQSCEIEDALCDVSIPSYRPFSDCCQDASISLQDNPYAQTVKEKSVVESVTDVFIPVDALAMDMFSFPAREHAHRSLYKPPLLERDIHLLDRSLLI